MPLTCSAKCSMALTGWTTTGALRQQEPDGPHVSLQEHVQLHALQEGRWRQPRPWRQAVEKLAEQKHHMEAKIGNMTCVMRELNVLDASNNIDVQAMKRDIQKYTMPSEWFKNKYEHRLTLATRWPPTCLLTSPTTPLSPVIPSAPSSSARSRCSPSAARRPRPSCACTRTSRTRLSPTLVPWRTSCRRPSSPSTSSSHLSCSCCTARRWTT